MEKRCKRAELLESFTKRKKIKYYKIVLALKIKSVN